MMKIEFAADKHPEKPTYGIIATINNGIRPVGPQTFSSEEAAIGTFLRTIGELMKPPST